jgi:DNA (cytosine-5)-methyltransferase 1
VAKPAPITQARPDERRTLVQEYLRLIVEAGADGFLFENVVSITHPRNKIVLETFLAGARAAGYETLFLRVNAVHYGVPQARHRIVILGLRGGLPSAPEPTHSEGASATLFLPPPVTAGEALRSIGFSRRRRSSRGGMRKSFGRSPPGRTISH